MKFAFAPESKPLDGYTIKRAIHRGGFGEVYYALTDAGKEVALKLLRQNMDVELRGVSQCLNLKHANLVTIFDIKTDADGDHWIVMEYVSGKTLEEIMQGYPKGMPIPEVQQWMDGFLKGLAFLHDSGIVHRDLKPANLFTEDDQIKIGDIGLSKFITQSHRSAQTQSVGTVYYMAPEVAHGKYGHEVDVYALGVILYEMLIGHVPFEGESTGEILMKHLTEKPNISLLPAQYQQLVAQALEKDPHKRISSVALFANQFNIASGNKNEPLEIPVHAFEQKVVSSEAKTVRYGEDGIHAPESKSTSKPVFTHPKVEQPQTTPHPKTPSPPTDGLANRFSYSIGQGLGSFSHWWNEQTTAIQVLLVVLAIVLSGTWVPLLFVGAVAGGVCFMVMLVIDICTGAGLPGSQPKVHTAPPKPPPQQAQQVNYNVPDQPVTPDLVAEQYKEKYRKKYQDKYRKKFHRKDQLRRCQPLTQRPISSVKKMTELFGSMSLAAVYVSLLTIIFQMTMSSEFTRHGATPIFWSGTICLGLASLFSVWGILIVSKSFEGSAQPGFVRRLFMIPVALLVAAASMGLVDYLLVSLDYHLTYNGGIRSFFGESLTQGSRPDKVPTFWGCFVFLGGMMFVRRWWILCDNYRTKSFRLVSVLLSVGLAFIWTLIFAFPVEIALMWSAVVSVVLQLVSPWTPPEKRVLPQEGM